MVAQTRPIEHDLHVCVERGVVHLVSQLGLDKCHNRKAALAFNGRKALAEPDGSERLDLREEAFNKELGVEVHHVIIQFGQRGICRLVLLIPISQMLAEDEPLDLERTSLN